MTDLKDIPKHIAFIMDGNGRWAKEKGLPRTTGHQQGVERLKELVKVSSDLGVQVVTFFAFSAENWSRPKQEIEVLMHFLDNFLDREVADLHKSNFRFRVIGRGDPIPLRLQNKIAQAQEKTRDNTGLIVVLALNYGSRQEIVDAVKLFAKDVAAGKKSADQLNEEDFGKYLYTGDLPDPDLLIRTSGEMRISNFLLWQLSYAELYFPEMYWPDFKKDDLLDAIGEYQNRERRYGKV